MRSLNCLATGVMMLCGVVAAARASGTASAYYVTDLGTLGARTAVAQAINNRGQIVGYDFVWQGSTGIARAFLYENGQMTPLGSLGGNQTRPRDINDAGQVVGFSNLPGTSHSHAFLYENGQITSLGSLGGVGSAAGGINASGQIAGHVSLRGNQGSAPGIYSDGQWEPLPTFGGTHGGASAITTDGRVVGQAAHSSGYDAFLYQDGKMIRLESFGGDFSEALDINDRGQVVGVSSLPGNQERRGFLYYDGQLTQLGTLGGTHSSAQAINSLGQIVGAANRGEGLLGSAVIFESGTAIDLNTLVVGDTGLWLRAAYDINDKGWIVGAASNTAGENRAFLLTPVPEPAGAALITCAVVLLSFSRRACGKAR